jgi:hypothetical protein
MANLFLLYNRRTPGEHCIDDAGPPGVTSAACPATAAHPEIGGLGL